MVSANAEALEHLVKGIVENPDEVNVDAKETSRGQILEVRVNPDDLGRVIGRGGRTAQSLRTVLGAVADGDRVRIDVIDTDNTSGGR
ncbi:MAG: RNA-binding protein [Leucobacter sp.]